MSNQMRTLPVLCRTETDEIKHAAGVPVKDNVETTSQSGDDFVHVDDGKTGEPQPNVAGTDVPPTVEGVTVSSSSIQLHKDENGNWVLNGVSITGSESSDVATAMHGLLSRLGAVTPTPQIPEPAPVPDVKDDVSVCSEPEYTPAPSVSDNMPMPFAYYGSTRQNAIKKAKQAEIKNANEELNSLQDKLDAATQKFATEKKAANEGHDAEAKLEDVLIELCDGITEMVSKRKQMHDSYRRTFDTMVTVSDENTIDLQVTSSALIDRAVNEVDTLLARQAESFNSARHALQTTQKKLIMQRAKVFAAQRARLAIKSEFDDQSAVVEHLEDELEMLK